MKRPTFAAAVSIDMRLSGARTIVTGASSGIGRAIALEFARRGAQVVLASRNGDALNDLSASIKAEGGRAIARPTDVTDTTALDRMVSTTVDELGGIDILVNNAGIGMHSGIADAAGSDVEALFRLNVLAAAAAIRAAVPVMRRQGSGLVINISSVAGRIVIPRIGYYSASKFALTAIGDALRLEESHRGIRVMNVFPGTTRSRFGENRLGIRGRAAHQRVPPVPAEKVARRVAIAVERNRRTVYVSWLPDRIGVAANHVAGWAVAGVLQRWARRAER
ncbi:MAG: SDR family NAD(P)-dependent oxidoreductase [Chloroflexi bacterium]|nr:MAG: SDR family NAD(P)-dependent oxidoreductase [Chloroflexota bacterium]